MSDIERTDRNRGMRGNLNNIQSSQTKRVKSRSGDRDERNMDNKSILKPEQIHHTR